jgi:hypothetical protein
MIICHIEKHVDVVTTDITTFNRPVVWINVKKKTSSWKFKTCGKGDVTAVKPQKSRKGLTRYFLMRWFITEVSIIIIYPYSERQLLSCLPVQWASRNEIVSACRAVIIEAFSFCVRNYSIFSSWNFELKICLIIPPQFASETNPADVDKKGSILTHSMVRVCDDNWNFRYKPTHQASNKSNPYLIFAGLQLSYRPYHTF